MCDSTRTQDGGCGCPFSSEQKGGYSKRVTKLILLEKDLKSERASKLTKTQGLKCPKGKIIRRAYITKTGKIVGSVCVKDTGAPGKSKRSIILESEIFSKFGYKHVTKLSKKQRHEALAKAVLRYGFVTVIKRLVALSNLTKRTHPNFSKKIKNDQEWLSKKYALAKKFKLHL